MRSSEIGKPNQIDQSDLKLSGGTSAIVVDLLAISPYYDLQLVKSLQARTGGVTLAAIEPFFDPSLFRRSGIRRSPPLIDLVSRLGIRITTLRRALASIEYLINLSSHLVYLSLGERRVVHIQWLPLFQNLPVSIELYWLSLLRRRRIPLLLTVHNLLPHDFHGRSERISRLYRSMDHLICHTEDARQRLILDHGVATENITVIPHGPLLPFSEIEGSKSDATKSLTALALGTLRRNKGWSFLLRSWARVVATRHDLHLMIAGAGPGDVADEIRQMIDSLDIGDNVTFLNRTLSSEEVVSLHRSAEFVILPYESITQSGALFAALSSATPVIATDLPAFREVLPVEFDPFLVPFGDENRLTDAILQLAGDSLRQSMLSHRGRQHVESNFSWDKIADSTLRLYEDLLGESRR